MKTPSKLYTIGSTLISLGVGLLLCVLSVVAYGRFEAWAQVQPRDLVTGQMLWPEVPPLTPLPTPTPTPVPTPGPPVWVEVPQLAVERAVVPVGKIEQRGQLAWDTDSLYATSNRLDLVGHLEGTANPGQTGNMVLVGHNYNRGFYNWEGIFCRLHTLQPGDLVYVTNQDDRRFIYEVENVTWVPWRARMSATELMSHIRYLAPTPDEVLTLASCGPAAFAPSTTRIYVTARRVLETE